MADRLLCPTCAKKGRDEPLNVCLRGNAENRALMWWCFVCGSGGGMRLD